ncbi:MAG: flagellar export protein FliJ [Pirellulales bacterium]|nr:flagellar export protein FliJ [Pirellulales bacterium]
MTTFRFRLTTLRRIREIHRDEMQMKLSEASQAETTLRHQLVSLRDEIGDLQNQRRDALGGPTTNVDQLLETERYHSVLRAQKSTMEARAKLLESEVLQQRQLLVDANRHVQVLDNLEQRQRTVHRQKIQQVENKQLDETASRERNGGQPRA